MCKKMIILISAVLVLALAGSASAEVLLQCDVGLSEAISLGMGRDFMLKPGWTLLTKGDYYKCDNLNYCYAGPHTAVTYIDLAGTGIDLVVDSGTGFNLEGRDRQVDPWWCHDEAGKCVCGALAVDYYHVDDVSGRPDTNIILTFRNLAAGVYGVRTYHNNPAPSCDPNAPPECEPSISYTDALLVSGEVSSSTQDFDIPCPSTTVDEEIGTGVVGFTATGAGDVVVTIVGGPLNAFELYMGSDSDGDGILDDLDNCPDNPKNRQTDSDQDGIGDVCDDDRDGDGVANDADNCPDDANKTEPGICGCGVADEDSDGDGVRCNDNCPNDPNAHQIDEDDDGIGDDCDNCPAVENEDQADKDSDGIGDACEGDIDLSVDIGIFDQGKNKHLKREWTEFNGSDGVGAVDPCTAEDIGGTVIDVKLTVGNTSDNAYRAAEDGYTGEGYTGDRVGWDYLSAMDGQSQEDCTITMTLSDVPRGDYTLTSYFNAPDGHTPGKLDIEVSGDGVEETEESPTNATGVSQTSLNDTVWFVDIGKGTVAFTADGTGDVVITYIPVEQGYNWKIYFNGFQLNGTFPEFTCMGDFDGSNQITLADLDAMVNLLVGAGPPFIVPCE